MVTQVFQKAEVSVVYKFLFKQIHVTGTVQLFFDKRLPSYTADAMRANWESPEIVKIIIYCRVRLKGPFTSIAAYCAPLKPLVE